MNQNDLIKRKRIPVILTLLFVSGLFLCGGIFDGPSVVMDTESHVIYQNIDAGEVIKAFAADSDAAKRKYDDNYYVFHGKITSKSKNAKEIVIGDEEGGRALTCTPTDDLIPGRMKIYSEGDEVMAYGKLSVGLLGGLNVKVDKLDREDNKHGADNYYSMASGSYINRDGMKKRTIEDTPVSFCIPPEWAAVEHDLVREKLGSMAGFQYRLNDLSPKKPYAESLFVCYFDKYSMVDINDMARVDEIEEAIIKDILGKEIITIYPLKRKTTYYGQKYKYYRDTYTKAGVDKYQTEFIFREYAEGIVVYLYIYQKPENIEDVMYTLRFIQP